MDRDDSGWALIAVVGLMAVGMVMTTLVLFSVTGAVGVTSMSNASVQSQASAEAGAAQLRAALSRDTCTGGTITGTDPSYTATVKWSTLADPNWASITPSCPPSSGNVTVQIRSTGYAETEGTISGGDQRSVEVRLTRAAPAVEFVDSGPAIYTYSSQGFQGSGNLASETGGNLSVKVHKGDVTCGGGGKLSGEVFIGDGNITIDGSCVVKGTVHAAGKITSTGGAALPSDVIGKDVQLGGWGNVGGSVYATNTAVVNGGTVNGSVVANGNTTLTNVTIKGNVWVNNTGATFTMYGGSTVVDNSVYAHGPVSLTDSAKIKGNLTSTTIFVNSANVAGKTHGTTSVTLGNGYFAAGGSLVTRQLIDQYGSANEPWFQGVRYPGGKTIGTVAPTYAAAPTIPEIPAVPAWIDFKYKLSDWAGFTEKKLTQCSSDQRAFADEVRSALNSTTGPLVIDARNCTNGFNIGSDSNLPINNDVAIIAHKFSMAGSAKFTSPDAEDMWFITEDEVADGKPTCTSPKGGFEPSGGFSMDSTITAMVYTPCRVTIGSSTVWRGQIYSGEANIAGGSTIYYRASGLPGVDLDGNSTTPVSSTPTWTFDWMRNVTPGG